MRLIFVAQVGHVPFAIRMLVVVTVISFTSNWRFALHFTQ
jgi:hypothetical protein